MLICVYTHVPRVCNRLRPSSYRRPPVISCRVLTDAQGLAAPRPSEATHSNEAILCTSVRMLPHLGLLHSHAAHDDGGLRLFDGALQRLERHIRLSGKRCDGVDTPTLPIPTLITIQILYTTRR